MVEAVYNLEESERFCGEIKSQDVSTLNENKSSTFKWKCTQFDFSFWYFWLVCIYGLVASGTTPLPEQVLTEIHH